MIASTKQLAIGFHGQSTVPQPRWFGLRLTHRTLFDALQTEWLSPAETIGGHLLLATGFAPLVRGADESRHPIEIGLRLDLTRLPDLPLMVLKGGTWVESSRNEISPDATAVIWPGPLPVSAILDGWVATAEQRDRLVGMARQVSNLPLVPLRVEDLGDDARTTPVLPERAKLLGLTFPDDYDGARGAAAMGLWALPRTDPWFDLLVESFARAEAPLTTFAADLEAPWLVGLPWRRSYARPRTFDEMLWVAALRVFGSWNEGGPQLLADAVTDAARVAGASPQDLQLWSETTTAILRADATVDLGLAQARPVATALHLVLTRSDPERFKTWATDHKEIPPAPWWSGAILCGLLRGYRRLPRQFRGDPPRRRFLALRLLHGARLTDEPLRWERNHGTIRFLVGKAVMGELADTARTAWFHADLEEPPIRDAAVLEATRLGWPCVRRTLRLPPGDLCLLGDGQVCVGTSSLSVTGDVRLLLPTEASLSEAIDPESFRRCLATWGGELATLPPGRSSSAQLSPRREHIESNVPKVPGLIYLDPFLSEPEESDIVARIDESPWMGVLKRRVQHYGWEYDYKARRIGRDMRIGALPSWAKRLADRLFAEGLLPWVADQMIVNEYVGRQGISKHIDCVPCFEEAIAMISLLESWFMRFTHASTKRKVEHELGRRSIAIMTGESRYDWSHEIPSRKREPSGLVRDRRISLTFRKVRLS